MKTKKKKQWKQTQNAKIPDPQTDLIDAFRNLVQMMQLSIKGDVSPSRLNIQNYIKTAKWYGFDQFLVCCFFGLYFNCSLTLTIMTIGKSNTIHKLFNFFISMNFVNLNYETEFLSISKIEWFCYVLFSYGAHACACFR